MPTGITNSTAGIGTSMLSAAAMAPMSAPALIVFATTIGEHDRVDDARRVVLLEDAGEAPTADQADLGADVLHRDHHRQHQDRGPEELVPVLGAGLRVGADARWVVVGRPRDQARPEDLAEPLQREFFSARVPRSWVDRAPGVDFRLIRAGR